LPAFGKRRCKFVLKNGPLRASGEKVIRFGVFGKTVSRMKWCEIGKNGGVVSFRVRGLFFSDVPKTPSVQLAPPA